ncbi:shikimate kinase [Teredinibacter turnerae]|uniref:shikimate kinase n=1 Tax=Teredinibacter turnerae TaxID=2426 RepID=UPI000366FAC5|nr:shikimate kinase [Teredinibacter turnerae]
MSESSVILIGMPGAGKSTTGVLLAKRLAKAFIDTDILIQQQVDMTLQDYLNQHGYMALRELEADVLMSASLENAVVATGGSAVYSDSAMRRLATLGPRVFLDLKLSSMLARIHNQATRGLASQPGATLETIFAERSPLYRQYADITVAADSGTAEEVVQAIVDQLSTGSSV